MFFINGIMSEEFIEYRCNICGSILKISPENIISICEYCGGLNLISGIIDVKDVYITPSVSVEEVLQEFWSRVRRDVDLKKLADKVRINSIQGWYIPFWVSRAIIDGEIVYTKKQYRGKKVEVIRRRERFSEEVDIDVIGRRQVKNIALRELIKAYFNHDLPVVEIDKLDESWWRSNKLSVLNIEFDKKESEIALREEAIDSIRRRWEQIADEIEFFKAEIKRMEKPKLILLPLWEIVYEYGGSLYSAYHEGWAGTPLIFFEPVTMGRRILYIAGMFTSIIMGVFIGSALSLSLFNNSDNVSLAILFLLFIVTFLGYGSAKRFISDVRVEKSWK
jgi:DNA-directed RNA polymerase subunit RPC12/RpoP